MEDYESIPDISDSNVISPTQSNSMMCQWYRLKIFKIRNLVNQITNIFIYYKWLIVYCQTILLKD